MLTYILFALGFVFLIKGADYLVEGSSALAKRIGVSDLVIGLTLVSFGTSAPELVVNIFASIKGASDVGFGNVLGSNIANLLLILGVSATIATLSIHKSSIWKAIPLSFVAILVVFFLANDALIDGMDFSVLTRSDGLILMIFFAIFMYYTFDLAKSEKDNGIHIHKFSIPVSVFMTFGGLVALAFGGRWVVDGAVVIARNIGITESLIGLTIVALGTSLPELATSAIAAYKGKSDIAIGNVVGSNIFNIFWVLGLSAVIRPMSFNPMINTDIMILLIATFLLFIFAFIGKKYIMGKPEGILFLFGYVAYIVFLVIRG